MPTEAWKKVTPPSEEQQRMLDAIADNYIKSPLGYMTGRPNEDEPNILPDVIEFWGVYGEDAIRDISTKRLDSDWQGASSLCRAATKEILVDYLSDEAWLGGWGYDTSEQFHDFIRENHLTKWHLLGILKILAYTFTKQNGGVCSLLLNDEEFKHQGNAAGVDSINLVGRLFCAPKEIVPIKGKFKMSDVMKESIKPRAKTTTKKISVKQVIDSTFSKEEMEQLVRHFQGLLNVEEKQEEIPEPTPEPTPEEDPDPVCGAEQVEVEIEGVTYIEDEETGHIYEVGTLRYLGGYNDDARDYILKK
jgi:hypothetical protein